MGGDEDTAMDLILRGANLPDGRTGLDIGIEKGRIAAVEPALQATGRREIDATGRLVTPTSCRAHRAPARSRPSAWR